MRDGHLAVISSMCPSCSSDLISCLTFLVVFSTVELSEGLIILFFSFIKAKPLFILLSLLIMMDVVSTSAFLSIMVLSATIV